MVDVGAFLEKRKAGGFLRRLEPADSRGGGFIWIKGKRYVDLSSNDYLGLSGHPAIRDASIKALERYGSSSSASRLLSGDLVLHHELEREIAALKQKESALLFNTGYQANLGIISALCGRNDAVFADRLCHASILDGAGLSGAKLIRFRHNDPGDLRMLLKEKRPGFDGVLIATESIFSMDGDRAPLKELADLSAAYGCRIMIDEAHATGVFGRNGAGVAEDKGVSGDIDIIMGTFGKALGGFGAYAALSETMKDFLVNSSRGFIYSTALPPAVVAGNLAAIGLLEKEPHRRGALLRRSARFRGLLADEGFDVIGDSQIVPVILGTNSRALDMSGKLMENGYRALAIRPPTVPEGRSRLRFSLTYDHDEEYLRGLINAMRP